MAVLALGALYVRKHYLGPFLAKFQQKFRTSPGDDQGDTQPREVTPQKQTKRFPFFTNEVDPNSPIPVFQSSLHRGQPTRKSAMRTAQKVSRVIPPPSHPGQTQDDEVFSSEDEEASAAAPLFSAKGRRPSQQPPAPEAEDDPNFEEL